MMILYQEKQRSYFSYKHETTLDFPPHLHDAIEIFFMEEGESCAVLEGKRYLLEKGDVFIAFPNLVHSYENSCGVKGTLLIIRTDVLKPCFQPCGEKIPLCPVLKQSEWSGSGLETLVPLALGDEDRESKAVEGGYFQIIVGKLLCRLKLCEPQFEKPSALKDILLYINLHYKESITRESLAKALGYDKSHISHVFSEALHTTLPHYINAMRAGDAAKLLSETGLSVTQIAALSGFGSLRSFNRAFLDSFHVSPRAFRR